MTNTLYYGDNLDIMRRYIKDEIVDLVYLDPPFNSNQNYNVLFKEKDGARAASQIRAFEDTWTWDIEDEEVYAELVLKGDKVAACMEAFRKFLGPCDLLAYLVMMAPRLVELRRVMKPTASIYLHCDPVASHYLKLLMDAVFGPRFLKNEIIWKRTSAHSGSKRWGPVHDVILYFTKGPSSTWNQVYQGHKESYLESFYRYEDQKGRFRVGDLTGAGIRKGESGQPWRGINPTENKRHWAVPNKVIASLITGETTALSPQEKLDLLDGNGLIYWPERGDMPGFKRYLETTPGVAVVDVITDIPPVQAKAAERLGYPTQKPVALLERIIQASSNEGDLVLDPFCGCGTTIAAAQKLNRRWIGIDITHLAVTLMKERLADSFGDQADYTVVGEPVSLPDAELLAKQDPYQFQWWALGLVGARPVEQKKGADKGIDGKIVFQGETAGQFETVILSVKAGHLTTSHVRDLRAVVEREKAAIGVLISFQEPTKPMCEEAATAGFYHSVVWNRNYPKVQLLTVDELLQGKRIEMPPIKALNATFQKAPKIKKGNHEDHAKTKTLLK